jgi:hypothetical protein
MWLPTCILRRGTEESRSLVRLLWLPAALLVGVIALASGSEVKSADTAAASPNPSRPPVEIDALGHNAIRETSQ